MLQSGACQGKKPVFLAGSSHGAYLLAITHRVLAFILWKWYFGSLDLELI